MPILDGLCVEVVFVRVITVFRCWGTSYLFIQGQTVVKQNVLKRKYSIVPSQCDSIGTGKQTYECCVACCQSKGESRSVRRDVHCQVVLWFWPWRAKGVS